MCFYNDPFCVRRVINSRSFKFLFFFVALTALEVGDLSALDLSQHVNIGNSESIFNAIFAFACAWATEPRRVEYRQRQSASFSSPQKQGNLH